MATFGPARRPRRRLHRLTLVAAAVALAGCGNPLLRELPSWEPIPEPTTDQIDAVIFLVGDAGYAGADKSPLLRRLSAEVEEWSGRLGRDSAVAVVFLGDNVYPRGLHPPGDTIRPKEAKILRDQAAVVGGPVARRYRTQGIFVAGNHDWGITGGPFGLQQLRNQELLLDSVRARGTHVRLLPEAGTAGPGVVDIGQRLRIVLLDTAWWLLRPTEEQKDEFMGRLETTLATRGQRSVMMAGHHPWASGGSHGGLVPFWRTLGLRFFLHRSGALLQDLNSLPYKEFRQRMQGIFDRQGSPLIYAGGHEHNLQVLLGRSDDDPHHILVSGSASKVSPVGETPGQIYRLAAPGFIRVVMLRNGIGNVFVTAAPEAFLFCDQTDPAAREACMAEAVDSYKTEYSGYLVYRP